MTPMPMGLMIELRDIFATRFDHDSLNDFALEFGVDYENLSGSSKSAKARELALHLWRHSKLALLAEVGPKRRPDIDWAALLDPHVAPATPAPELPARGPRLDFRDLQKLAPILAAHAMFQTPDSRGSLLAIVIRSGWNATWTSIPSCDATFVPMKSTEPLQVLLEKALNTVSCGE